MRWVKKVRPKTGNVIYGRPTQGAVNKLFRLKGGGGQKLLILHGKKTTKRWGGCKKLLILRRHSSWTAPKWSNLMIMFLFWLVPVCSSHNRCPCSFLSMTGYFKGLCQDWLWTNGLIYWGHPRCTWLEHHGLLYHMERKVVNFVFNRGGINCVYVKVCQNQWQDAGRDNHYFSVKIL